MTEPSIQDRYFALLKRYVSKPAEQQLVEVAELGRLLVRANVPPEEISEIHETAIHRLAEESPQMPLLEAARLISAPLMELFMAYGLVFRERLEVHRRAEELLEKAHDELEAQVHQRTAELATANARLQQEMTERIQGEQREQQLRAELAHMERLTTMGEMASSLAHELNQPLGAIANFAHAAIHAAQAAHRRSEQKLVRLCDEIVSQALRAGELVRRMRQFVKKIAPKRTTFALREAIRDIIPLVESDFRHAGITIYVELDESLPATVADKIQVEQVLLNLTRNALEAMRCTEFDAHELNIEAKVRGGNLEIAVGDTGEGIPDEQTHDLFRAFYSTKSQGLGMGLAICRSIVEAHGGRIWAAPRADRGTTFTFTLPIAGPKQHRAS